MLRLGFFLLLLALVGSAGLALGQPPTLTDLSQTSFAHNKILTAAVLVSGKRLRYVSTVAKGFTLGANQYYAVPLAEDPRAAVPPYVQITVFLVQHSSLKALATVPQTDPNFRYGYGFSPRADGLFLIRPSTESSKKCCKFNRIYLYGIHGTKVWLKKSDLELNLP